MKLAIIGGHLTPALSVIEALPKDCEVTYIGRKYALEGDKATSLEFQTITEKGIPFIVLKTGRIQRQITRHTITSISKIPYGFMQSFKVLRKVKPDVVMGFGGYVSFPIIVAAKALKIPIVIHEQTLEAGAANKMAAKFADKICISFPTSAKYFPKEKTILTGNPIRSTITAPGKKFKIDSEDPIIYVTGGSQGSHFINQIIKSSLSELLEKYIVVHQTGAATEFNDFEKLEILRNGFNVKKRERYIVSKFFSPEDVGSIMKAASLIVSRAGINSVSEIIVLKKPAILIPLPGGQKNEQLKNAMFIKKLGLSEVVEQKDLTPESFLILVKMMFESIDKYKITDSARHFPHNAAGKIVEIIYDLQKNRN
jgi:UDP-N-acetylglucosamine--N-acetylmuramyl-(pentapeptide) pyrophosphoryl-undecaprenol N-acetylglucosamine transferase